MTFVFQWKTMDEWNCYSLREVLKENSQRRQNHDSHTNIKGILLKDLN